MQVNVVQVNRRVVLKSASASLLGTSALSLTACATTNNETAALLDAARQEGRVVVHSVLSNRGAQPVIDAFETAYPGVKVDYDGALSSNELTQRFRNSALQRSDNVDIMWNSAMDLQMQLVGQGFAATYRSPQLNALVPGSHFRHQAFATTSEPVVLVYNKRLMAPNEVPQTRDALISLLKANPIRFSGKITTLDIAASGVAAMLATEDMTRCANYEALLSAMAQVKMRLSTGTGSMLEGVNRGDFLLGYNAMGTYALTRSIRDLPDLGVVFPTDYTLALSRVAFINKAAPPPNAARLWLDFLLSFAGQTVLAGPLGMIPVRKDVVLGPLYPSGGIGPFLRSISLSPDLARDLDTQKQRDFLSRWKTLVST